MSKGKKKNDTANYVSRSYSNYLNSFDLDNYSLPPIIYPKQERDLIDGLQQRLLVSNSFLKV